MRLGAGAWTLAALLALHPGPALAAGAAATRHWPGQGEPAVERVRRCILQREARGDYTAVDPKGRWFGGYQFMLAASNVAARRMGRPDLVGVTADQWPPEDQDAAFYLIYNRGRGKRAWRGGRFACF